LFLTVEGYGEQGRGGKRNTYFKARLLLWPLSKRELAKTLTTLRDRGATAINTRKVIRELLRRKGKLKESKEVRGKGVASVYGAN